MAAAPADPASVHNRAAVVPASARVHGGSDSSSGADGRPHSLPRQATAAVKVAPAHTVATPASTGEARSPRGTSRAQVRPRGGVELTGALLHLDRVLRLLLPAVGSRWAHPRRLAAAAATALSFYYSVLDVCDVASRRVTGVPATFVLGVALSQVFTAVVCALVATGRIRPSLSAAFADTRVVIATRSRAHAALRTTARRWLGGLCAIALGYATWMSLLLVQSFSASCASRQDCAVKLAPGWHREGPTTGLVGGVLSALTFLYCVAAESVVGVSARAVTVQTIAFGDVLFRTGGDGGGGGGRGGSSDDAAAAVVGVAVSSSTARQLGGSTNSPTAAAPDMSASVPAPMTVRDAFVRHVRQPIGRLDRQVHGVVSYVLMGGGATGVMFLLPQLTLTAQVAVGGELTALELGFVQLYAILVPLYVIVVALVAVPAADVHAAVVKLADRLSEVAQVRGSLNLTLAGPAHGDADDSDVGSGGDGNGGDGSGRDDPRTSPALTRAQPTASCASSLAAAELAATLLASSRFCGVRVLGQRRVTYGLLVRIASVALSVGLLWFNQVATR